VGISYPVGVGTILLCDYSRGGLSYARKLVTA
jgi:hypothetical protein